MCEGYSVLILRQIVGGPISSAGKTAGLKSDTESNNELHGRNQKTQKWTKYICDEIKLI
jgi:hypothetical protein